MAHDGFLYGLSLLKFKGVEIGYIDDDGVDWGGSAPETNKVYAAQKPQAPVKVLKKNNGENELSFNLIELKHANVQAVYGGTVVGDKYSAPSEIVNLEGPVEITTADGTKIEIPKCSMVSLFKGKLKHMEVFKIECKLTMMAPDGGGSPFIMTEPT